MLRAGGIAGLCAVACACACVLPPGGVGVGRADVATRLPPELVSLEQKTSEQHLPPAVQAIAREIAQASVTSETFTQTIQGRLATTIKRNGHERVKTTPIHAVLHGEASLSPVEAELSANGHPQEVLVGSQRYAYWPGIVRGRPWVRSDHATLGEDPELFPFHGGAPDEADYGGNGSFAGLINLMATGSGAVTILGPETVQGQATTGFAMQVDPLELIATLTPQEIAAFRRSLPVEMLEAFVNEQGVPVRVVVTRKIPGGQWSESFEIQTVDVPVSIKPPPARETISQQRFDRLLSGKTSHRCSGKGGSVVRRTSSTVEGCFVIEVS